MSAVITTFSWVKMLGVGDIRRQAEVFSIHVRNDEEQVPAVSQWNFASSPRSFGIMEALS